METLHLSIEDFDFDIVEKNTAWSVLFIDIMRQTISKIFRANIANSSRTLIMGATTASLFMWQYKQNRIPLMNTYASCAALNYTLPS